MKARYLAVLVIILIGVLAGCNESEESSVVEEISSEMETFTVEYTEEKSLRYIEPHGTAVFNSCSGYSCTYENVHYIFPKIIEENERNIIVKETENILGKIEAETGASRPENLCVTIIKEDYEARTEETTLYVGYSSFGSVEYIIGLSQAYMGADVNYGILYGMSCSIGETLGYEVNVSTDLTNAFELDERTLLDMNYACFLERYAGEDLEKIKTISRELYTSLSQDEKLGLFSDYADVAFYNYLNQFLMENDQEIYENQDIWGINIANGGEAVRLHWWDEWVDYYLMEEFKDLSAEGYMGADFRGFGKDPLNSDYTDLRIHIVAARNRILDVRERLNMWEDGFRKENVDVVYDKMPTSIHPAAEYDNYNKVITTYTVRSVQHEYVHHLLAEFNLDMYREHIICYYFDYVPDIEKTDSNLIYYQWCYDYYYLKSEDADLRKKYERLMEYVRNEMDWSDIEDVNAMIQNEVIDRISQEAVLDNGNSANEQINKAAFSMFLAIQHGEEKMILALINDTPEELGYTSWEDAIDAWEIWVHDMFELY